MRTDYQAGDIVKCSLNNLRGRVITSLRPATETTPELLAVKFEGAGFIDNAFVDSLKKIHDWEDLKYPLTISKWRSLTDVDRESVMDDVLQEHMDEFSDDMRKYIQHPQNLALFKAFVSLAVAKKQTHEHYGSKAIFEELRFSHFIRDSDTHFKINNSRTADLARLAMRILPELEDFFETRRRVA